jgi:hypothetical protein
MQLLSWLHAVMTEAPTNQSPPTRCPHQASSPLARIMTLLRSLVGLVALSTSVFASRALRGAPQPASATNDSSSDAPGVTTNFYILQSSDEVWSFAAVVARLLYAALSHLVRIICGFRP